MPNYKSRHVYSMLHKHLGNPASSLAVIPNNGVTKITAAATYALAGPEVGSLVTIYAVGVDATIVSTCTAGQVSFNSGGGAQKLNLLYDSTVQNDPCVTLIGEATTQWRVLSFTNAAAFATSNSGISVTS